MFLQGLIYRLTGATTMQLSKLFILTILLLLNACTQNPYKIASATTLCCPGDFQEYTAYKLNSNGLPLFLRAYVLEEFENAIQEKGLIRNDQINDLMITLSYKHINLTAEQEEIDPFFRQESIQVELKFIAKIIIEMHETASNNLVWAGQINRIHTVQPGEYMHDERARGEFLMAFRNMLASYPIKSAK